MFSITQTPLMVPLVGLEPTTPWLRVVHDADPIENEKNKIVDFQPVNERITNIKLSLKSYRIRGVGVK